MTDSMSVLNIKQEIQESGSNINSINCYSPSTTTTTPTTKPNNRRNSGSNSGGAGGLNGMKSSPSVSPERQMCSSTTTLSLNSNGSYTATEENGTNNVASAGTQVSQPSQSTASAGTSIRDELRRLCLVCGDVASGFHYGVASCEACKAFFKRTIQGNIEYTCPANNECEINKRRRKACQACRFQKCLLMGMLKEGVRLDRVRGGRQKYRRNPVSNAYQTMQLLYQSNVTNLADVKILDALSNYEPDILSVQTQTPQNNNGNSSTSSLLEDEVATTPTTTTSSPNIKHEQQQHNLITNSTDNIDVTPPSTPTSSNTGSSFTALNTSCIFQLKSSSNNNNNEAHDILSVLSDLYDKELLNVIAWAKQIPGFPELQLSDQMKLLQVSWAEILTLQLIFRSLPFNGKLRFASDVWMDELLAKECGYTEFYYHCVQVAQRLERISARREEYYLLKALILTNCDILLDDQSSLRAFRDSILNSLNDVVYLLRHSAAVSHQQQLLLILPSLRQADNILRRFWRNVNTDGLVSLKKLFLEMLEPVPR